MSDWLDKILLPFLLLHCVVREQRLAACCLRGRF